MWSCDWLKGRKTASQHSSQWQAKLKIKHDQFSTQTHFRNSLTSESNMMKVMVWVMMKCAGVRTSASDGGWVLLQSLIRGRVVLWWAAAVRHRRLSELAHGWGRVTSGWGQWVELTDMVFLCADLPGGEPFWLHGEHLPGGKDQLLWEAGGRVPEDGRDGDAHGQHLPVGRWLLRRWLLFGLQPVGLQAGLQSGSNVCLFVCFFFLFVHRLCRVFIKSYYSFKYVHFCNKATVCKKQTLQFHICNIFLNHRSPIISGRTRLEVSDLHWTA